jgi:hypothetical protein
LCDIVSVKEANYMTIKEYAAEQQISPQAVYQRLKKNKIRVETLTEKGSGEITGEGMVILDKLFDPENQQKKLLKDEKIESLQDQLSVVRQEKAALEERVKWLEEKSEILKDMLDSSNAALSRAQDIHKQFLATLPAPQPENASTGGGSERLTWKERLTGRRRS